MKLSDAAIRACKTHAATAPDSEVCGFIYGELYIPLRNISDDSRSFQADPRELARVLAFYGEPQAIFHSHPNGYLQPSEQDRRQFYYPGSTMIIGSNLFGEFRLNLVQLPVYGHGGD